MGAKLRVRFCHMCAWVLTSPGVTRQPDASIRCCAAGSCPGRPTESTSPLRTATHPPAISVPTSSTVATRVAPATSRSTGSTTRAGGRAGVEERLLDGGRCREGVVGEPGQAQVLLADDEVSGESLG